MFGGERVCTKVGDQFHGRVCTGGLVGVREAFAGHRRALFMAGPAHGRNVCLPKLIII
jgi:hypothetical protein